MSPYGTPTVEEVSALRAYAAGHGRTWKAQLLQDWMTGRSTGELQRVRNNLGPTWLIRFKFTHPAI